ncbi:MAG: phenylalanine--tRNA ligase subunit alpha [Mycoplasmatota bacterium]|nr:phenylalanine--tRNA ligase subunit alpha [Mycoplasmatota bacterium]
MKIEEIRNTLIEDLEKVSNLKELNDLKVEYLGKKGKITELNQMIKDIPNEEKKEFGQKVNEIRTLFNNAYEEKKNKFEESLLNEKLEKETIDITLPSKKVKRGSKHPMTRITEKFEDLFVSMGYTVYEGPEIESDENCFQKLNLPKGHPARDAQDTFYLKDEYENFLLRSQTSTAQVRAMEDNKEKGPIRIVCPGKVYRRDEDATHSHQFMQIEGLVIDENISMADLKGTLELFCKTILGEKTKVRFRPSFFPFTEPSVEVDVTCFKCGGKGCALCKQTGWIEVLGAGMVHPNVLEMSGYDSTKYQGFAFGTGMDRFAMFKYGIPDIRTIYGNDIRFIEQFDRKEDE